MIDLRQWNFSTQGPVSLKGQWEFYWEQHIPVQNQSPDTVNTKKAEDHHHGLIEAPGLWNRFRMDGRKIDGIGHGSYRVRILIDPSQDCLGLKFLDMATAFRAYVNGEPAYQAGVPGSTKADTIPSYSPGVALIGSKLDVIDLVIHVSNFHHWKGGMWENIRIGKAEQLFAKRERALVISSLLFGAICIIGLYHIGLFCLRKKDRSPLYFGLFCLVMALRIITQDERYIMSIFPGLDFGILIRLVYLSLYACVPLFVLYVRGMFPQEIPEKLPKAVTGVSLLFALLVIILPSRWFSLTLGPYQVFILCLLIFGIFPVYFAVNRNRQGALIFLAGFCIFLVAVINDILYSRLVIWTGYYVPLALFIFLFLQAYIISQRFSMAFSTIRNQQEVLEMESRNRQLMSAHLKESEERYRQMVELLPIPVGEYDFELNVLYANKAGLDWFGYTREEMEAGVNISKHISDKSKSKIAARIKRLQQGEELGPVEVEMYRRDGSSFYGQATPSLIYKDDRPVAIRTCFVDLSELKKAQNALLHSAEQEKYALVGQVAGKMAHDFNNILGAIMGNADLALLECEDPEMKDTLNIILEQSMRGTTMTRNLVAFAKDQEIKEEFFNINTKIELVLELLRKDLKQINVMLDLQDQIPTLLADPGMVEHALVNIIQNSVHAVSMTPDPGIRIRTRSASGLILIGISDNGCGIPEEHHKDIYDPAFTLKGSQDIRGVYQDDIKGTGYGMSNVKKCVDKHGGGISFSSSTDNGTTFTLSFPIVEQQLTIQEKESISKHPVTAEKRILVVEDEAAIASVQTRILSASPFKHTVFSVSDAQEAMDAFQRESYDLVSLDYMLDGNLTGYDVYRFIREQDAVVPIIFVSGNIRFLKSMDTLKLEDTRVDHLPKPYRNFDYVNMVNRWLAQPQPR